MLEIEGLRKSYPGERGPVHAIDGVDLGVGPGRLLTMLGPSGCGKTTTLRCIAGLERPDAGRIVIDGKVMVDIERGIYVPASERHIGMVFQSYAIWPHMSVFENVAFPLRVARDRRYSQTEIRALVATSLGMVRLGGYEGRRSTDLSGGQQQRLAFARGIVRTPGLLLLDEPLSNLDARLRDEMRAEIKRLQVTLGITMVYVTHDQSEALALSDEIALFNAGRIVQRATPGEIYGEPASRFVADFIGAANFLPGTVLRSEGGLYRVRTGQGEIRCRSQAALAAGADVTLAVRPERIHLAAEPPGSDDNALPGTVAGRSFFGEIAEYAVDLGGPVMRVRTAPHIRFDPGQQVFAVFAATDCQALTS